MAPSEAMRRPLTNVRPWNSMVSPGLSSVPANRLPIMTASAPAAMALVMSPENLMPPSAINGTPAGPVAREHSAIAVSCGTPAPETTRVVQIDPGPIPTLMPSTPSEINSQAPSYVATFPVMSCTCGSARLSAFTAAMTRSVCPWAVSMASTSTLRATSSCATSASWLTVNNASTTGGSSGGSFNIDVNPASLAPGPYSGTVCVYTAASNSSASSTPCVTVHLTATSSLVGSPSALTFNSVNSATPSTQPLNVTTSPISSVPFTATSNQSWLTVNGASTASGTTGVTAITVAANPAGVPAGVNSGTITLTSTASGVNSATVNVTFNVTTVPTPAALTFTAPAGGANPPTQPLSVTSSGPAVSYTAAVTSGNAWLSVSPGSGTTNGAAQTVSVNTSGLGANTYSGTITITPSGGAAIPVGVTLTLLPAMVPGSASLAFTYTPGSSPSTTLGITSSGSTAISYNVAVSTTSGGSWLQALPSGGATPGSETVSIVTGVASTLATGTYHGAVVFTCSPTTSCGNTSGQLSVPVTLTVMATLTPAPSSLTFNYT